MKKKWMLHIIDLALLTETSSFVLVTLFIPRV